MKRCAFTALICTLLLIISVQLRAQDTAPGPQQLTDAEKIYGLSLFWQEANYNFAFFDQVPDLDWNAAYQEYIPKVLATKSMKEYWRVMMRFCALLHDGHTNIYPPRELWDKKYYDRTAIRLSSIGKRAIVVNIDADLAGQVPLGSEIIIVDGVPTETYLRENVLPLVSSSTEHIRWNWAINGNVAYGYGLAVGEPMEKATYTIRTPAGEEREVTMIRNERARFDAGALTWAAPVSPRLDIIEHRWPEDGLLYLGLNSFVEREIIERFQDEIVPELSKARGMIIDLRHNGGGNDGIAVMILDHFIDEPVKSPAWRTRKHFAAYKAWGMFDPEDEDYGPYARGDAWFKDEPFVFTPTEGTKCLIPTVVLIGYDTASAAENMLVFIDGQDRFTTVGEPTFGSTGQPLMFDLPGGGSARVCTKRNTYPDGREFVGYGVQPEVPVERTIPYLIGEEDPFLDKGIEVLKSMIAGKKY